MSDINYTRQLAMIWWKRFCISEKNKLINVHMPNRPKVLEGVGLTGREIENIFNAEIPDINVQILYNTHVRNLKSNKVQVLFIPDERLGLYLSLLYLRSKGKNVNKLIEKKIVDLNPTRFEYI